MSASRSSTVALTVAPPFTERGHRPLVLATTPGRTWSVTSTSATNAPRSLNTRTVCPFLMPRAAASEGFIHSSSGSMRASCGWLPWIECVRARDLGLHSISGKRVSGSIGSIQRRVFR
jgi:hypothetical protein